MKKQLLLLSALCTGLNSVHAQNNASKDLAYKAKQIIVSSHIERSDMNDEQWQQVVDEVFGMAGDYSSRVNECPYFKSNPHLHGNISITVGGNE